MRILIAIIAIVFSFHCYGQKITIKQMQDIPAGAFITGDGDDNLYVNQDSLRSLMAADLIENIAVDPYTSIPDSLHGRFFTSTSDSIYYVDYSGDFVNLTSGGAWDDLTGIPDSIVYTSELAAAQQAAEDYADANDDVDDADASPTNEAQTISAAGSTSPTINLTTAGGAGGGTVTLVGAGATTFGRSGNTITATTTEVDGSTTNELQTFGVKTGTNYTLSGGGGTIDVADNDNDPTNELYDDTAIQSQVDALPTDADVAAAQAAAQAYADANDEGSNWTSSGANIYRASGSVAIGTATPAYPFDVRGNANFSGLTFFRTGSNYNSRLTFNTNAVNHPSLYQFQDGGGGYGKITIGGTALTSSGLTVDQIGRVGINNANPADQLSVSGNASLTGAMAINGNATVGGNFGIGTTSPLSKLDVRGSTTIQGPFNLYNPTVRDSRLTFNTNTPGFNKFYTFTESTGAFGEVEIGGSATIGIGLRVTGNGSTSTNAGITSGGVMEMNTPGTSPTHLLQKQQVDALISNSGIYINDGIIPAGRLARSYDRPGGVLGRTNLYFARSGFSSTYHTGFESFGNNNTGFKLDHRVNGSGTTISSSLSLSTGAHQTTLNADKWYYDNGSFYRGFDWSRTKPGFRVNTTQFVDMPNTLPPHDNSTWVNDDDGGNGRWKTLPYKAFRIRNTNYTNEGTFVNDADLTLTVPGGNYTVEATIMFEGNTTTSQIVYRLGAYGSINSTDENGYVSVHTNAIETTAFNGFGDIITTPVANNRYQVTMRGSIKFFSAGGTVRVEAGLVDDAGGKTITMLEGGSLILTPQY